MHHELQPWRQASGHEVGCDGIARPELGEHPRNSGVGLEVKFLSPAVLNPGIAIESARDRTDEVVLRGTGRRARDRREPEEFTVGGVTAVPRTVPGNEDPPNQHLFLRLDQRLVDQRA
jgi:hypothetical protein